MDDYVVPLPDNGAHAMVKTRLGESADTYYDANKAMIYGTVAKSGSRKSNSFRFDEQGQLVMGIRVDNSRLSEPIALTVRYARKK